MKAMRFFLMLALVLVAQVGMAQTRKIGHRSHSGSPATFAMLLEEDHLGAYIPREKPYEVEPFIQKVRRHYEKIAAQNPSPQAEQPKDMQGGTPTDSTKASVAPEEPAQQKGDKQPKRSSKSGAPMATEVPSPDFLVQTQLRQSAPVAISAPTSPDRGWMVWGLLAVPIAPGIFVASAIRGRKRPVA